MLASPDLPRAPWRTSSLSSPGAKECVEVAPLDRTVAVRDSKDPDGSAFVFTREEWAAFVASARRDDLA